LARRQSLVSDGEAIRALCRRVAKGVGCRQAQR
jgi:hypothetical protein